MSSHADEGGAGNPSPVWEKGRDEGLRYPQKA